MEMGIVSDLHGNLPATEAVFEDASPDKWICLGDFTGSLGWPEETASLVREECMHVLLGNHDAYVSPTYDWKPSHPTQIQENDYVLESYSDETIEWIAGLPKQIWQRTWVAAHANPFDRPYTGYPAVNYVDPKDYIEFAAEHVDGETVLFGHTHKQAHLELDKYDGQTGTLVNPGTVGYPTDGNASYALLDTETNDVELREVSYDNQRVLDRLEEDDLLNQRL